MSNNALAEYIKNIEFEDIIRFENNKAPVLHFDPHNFPEPYCSYVIELSKSLQISSDAAAASVLIAVGAALQGKCKVRLNRDWEETPNLYGLIIAGPSERKSPLHKKIIKPFKEYEKFLKNSGAGKVQLIADDVTIEALALILNSNNGKTFLTSSEGGLFENLAGRYSKNGNDHSNLDLVKKGYSAEDFRQDRVSRNAVNIDMVLVSILIFLQPGPLEDIVKNSSFVDQGLLARFLMCQPESMLGKRSYKSTPLSAEVEQAYCKGIIELLSMPDEECTISLSEEADKVAEDFYNQIEQMLGSSTSEAMTSWLGKAVGNFMRIAAVLHYMEHGTKAYAYCISENTMKNARSIAEYFIEQTETVYQMHNLMDSDPVRDAKVLLSHLSTYVADTNSFVIKRASLYANYCRSYFKETKKMDPGINELIKRHYIKKITVRTGSAGRPSDVLVINPMIIEKV